MTREGARQLLKIFCALTVALKDSHLQNEKHDFFQVKDSIVYSQLQPKLVDGQLLSAVCNKMCSNSVGITSQGSIIVHVWLAVNGFLSMFNCPLPFPAQKVRGQIGRVVLCSQQ